MKEEAYRSLLHKALEYKASDVLLKPGQAPAFRVGGELRYVSGPRLTPAHTVAAVQGVLRDAGRSDDLNDLRQLDLAYEIEGAGRFRVNIYRQRGTLALAFRAVPSEVPELGQLGAPPVLEHLANLKRGLVLVVGAAGNGKSTTLASMIAHMNRTRRIHIITIEDPIEFLHQDQLATVSQREVGIDTESFAYALRGALRQNPDTILVGEIRDAATMEIALQAAETGHLVLSTLHTPDVSRTVGRILSLTAEQDPRELRERLSGNLKGVVAQRLLRTVEGGLALACEVLVVTGTAQDAIRRPETSLPLKDIMERGQHPYGMQTFEMAVEQLVNNGRVDSTTAEAALK